MKSDQIDTPIRAHLVALRRDGDVQAWQLRVGSGGPGMTKSFAALKHGGAPQALAEARRYARALGIQLGGSRGGSPKGRRNSRSPSPAPGIRFEWHSFSLSTVLYVVVSWTDRQRRARCSRYSVERHGLDGALDKAIKIRIAAGAPAPDRQALIDALRETHRQGSGPERKRAVARKARQAH